jgi:hypothetical protein
MPAYSEGLYSESIGSTTEEVLKEPADVLGRLLGRLNRSFGGTATIIPK